jgi:hypothetical protein
MLPVLDGGEFMPLLTELKNETAGTTFYKHVAPDGAVRPGEP